MDIVDTIYNDDGTVTVIYSDGRRVTYKQNSNSSGTTGNGTTGSGSGTGWLTGLLGAIPGILSSLFPSGVTGGNSNNYPYVTTNPNGQTQVNFTSSSNLLLIVLIGMVAFLVFTSKPSMTAKRK